MQNGGTGSIEFDTMDAVIIFQFGKHFGQGTLVDNEEGGWDAVSLPLTPRRTKITMRWAINKDREGSCGDALGDKISKLGTKTMICKNFGKKIPINLVMGFS